jgi:hypothetical protein
LYTGGISVTGQSNVTFNPGIYYIDGGGLQLTGQGNITANHVMFYVVPHKSSNNDGVNISGQGTINITPMTHTDNATYSGITIFEQRTGTSDVSVTGNGNMTIDGTLYAAKAAINVNGNGGVNNIGSELISNTLNVTGNGVVNINYLGTAPPPRRYIGLVE